MKYKIGDRVKAICDVRKHKVKGKEGTIMAFFEGQPKYFVYFKDIIVNDDVTKGAKRNVWLEMNEYDLELIPSKIGEDMLKELGYIKSIDDEEHLIYVYDDKQLIISFMKENGNINSVKKLYASEDENIEEGIRLFDSYISCKEVTEEYFTIPELKAIIQIFREKGVEI